MSRVRAFMVIAGLCLATAPTAAPAHAIEPPTLVGFEYLNGPYAWDGKIDHPVAQVVLDEAPTTDTAVSVTSSNPDVEVPGSVTVTAGTTTAVVPVTTLGSGTTTLTATLGATSISATPDLLVRDLSVATALSALEVAPETVAPGATATATVTLDFLAPPGGTAVTISTSDPELGVPAEVVVPADQYQATFPVPAPLGYSGEILITATVGDVSRQATLTVADPDPDGDGVAGDDDRCPDTAGTTADGCPKVGAEVALSYRAAAEKFRGRVTAASGCDDGRKITVFRVVTGPDAKIGTATTDDGGAFAVVRRARPGRYYAKAAARDVSGARCLSATSASIRVR